MQKNKSRKQGNHKKHRILDSRKLRTTQEVQKKKPRTIFGILEQQEQHKNIRIRFIKKTQTKLTRITRHELERKNLHKKDTRIEHKNKK